MSFRSLEWQENEEFIMRFLHASKLAVCFSSVARILTSPSCLLPYVPGILDNYREFPKLPENPRDTAPMISAHYLISPQLLEGTSY